jgi:hypothetical protein
VKEMDINEVAKQYTRKDFLNMTNSERSYVFDGGNCPSSHGLARANCREFDINDYNCANLCWQPAIKDIKFKDEIWVKCINDLGSKALTIDKDYMLISQGDTWIEIRNDSNINYKYLKEAFEILKEVKENKAYNFREVITNIQPREKYECEGFRIKCCDDGTIEIYNTSTGTKIGFYKYDTFEKIEPKPVKFLTAWEAFEEGKIIESTYTLDRYKKIDGLINIQHQGGEFGKCGNIATTEIGNSWIIVD